MLRSRLPELLIKHMRDTGEKLQGKEIAERAGVNKGTVSKLMSTEPIARPDYATSRAIAELLGVAWHDLFFEDTLEETPDPA